MPKNIMFKEILQIESDENIVMSYIAFAKDVWKEKNPDTPLEKFTFEELENTLKNTFNEMKKIENKKIYNKMN